MKDHLEKSAEHYRQVSGTGPFTPDQLTDAVTAVAPHGTPALPTNDPSTFARTDRRVVSNGPPVQVIG